MRTFIYIALLASVFGNIAHQYSTTSVVTLIGSKIKTEAQNNIEKKYPRKDCPVCKGKGWYMSGDDISKIDCQYCEPEKKTGSNMPTQILHKKNHK